MPSPQLLGRQAKARLGKFFGPAPYGYRRCGGILAIDPVEAPVARRIFSLYLRLRSVNHVRAVLAAAGLKTRSGHEWTVPGLLLILRNTTYLGRVHFGREVNVRGAHPPLLAGAILFNRVQACLARPARGSTKVSNFDPLTYADQLA